jgi:propanediol dehydratase small subunit
MKGKKLVKKQEVANDKLMSGIATQEITSDFVLEIYERAKKSRGKKKKELIAIAEKLSKHVGKWLVE